MSDNQTTIARRERAAVFARDAVQARSEYDDEARAVEERTEKLRRARLARDAKLAAASDAKPAARGKRSAGKTTTSPAASRPKASNTDQKPTGMKSAESPHRFAVGDHVIIAVKGTGTVGARGSYRIVRQLPPERGDNIYRVKSDQELHERVVPESRLKRTT